MKARTLLAGATYQSDILKVVYKAFDDAWNEIAHHFEGSSDQSTSARERLAHAVLAIANDKTRDAEQLKNSALQIMAMTYKDHLRSRS